MKTLIYALIKQFEKLFSIEHVQLTFTLDALKAIAHKAFVQKTGARGLRSILEEVMLDLMYDIPSVTNVREVIISEETINNGALPKIIRDDSPKKTASGAMSA